MLATARSPVQIKLIGSEFSYQFLLHTAPGQCVRQSSLVAERLSRDILVYI